MGRKLTGADGQGMSKRKAHMTVFDGIQVQVVGRGLGVQFQQGVGEAWSSGGFLG